MHLSSLSPVLVALIALMVAVQATMIPVQERGVSTPKKHSLDGRRGHAHSQIQTTCSRFRSACIKAALSGKKSGTHAVVYDCYKKEAKNKHYFFSCRIGKKDYTAQALENLSGGTTSTIYTASLTDIETITDTQLTSTTSTYSSTHTDTETDFSTDEYKTTTFNTVGATTTQPETLVQSYTTTSTTTIDIPTTVVLTNTVTSTSFSTSYNNVGYYFPEVYYQITSGPPLRRVKRMDKSSFCRSYSHSCNRRCERVGSKPMHKVCHQKSINRFSLSCICKNKKVETQHALKEIGDDQHVMTISTIATSLATATVTSTVVVPTTVVTTQMTTTTSHVPVTSTIVATVTSIGTVTATTTTSTTATAAATSLTTVPVATTTSTETATVVATTVLVLAPTGVVKASSPYGPDSYFSGPTTNRFYTLVSDIEQAEPVMLVADATTGLYALQYISGGEFLSIENGNTFDQNSNGYLVSSAGRAAGPAGGAGPLGGHPYESYVYSISPDAITEDGTPIQGSWIQPDGSQYPVYFNFNNPIVIVAGSATEINPLDYPPLLLSVVPVPPLG